MIKAMLAGDCKKEAQAEMLVRSDQWVAQEKIDGHRVLFAVSKSNGVQEFNRNGARYSKGVPKAIKDGFASFPFEGVFDGELMDGRYYLFDLPMLDKGGESIVNLSSPYEFRLDLLDRMLTIWQPADTVTVVPTFRTPDHKRALIQKCMDDGREGVVFKKLTGRYAPETRGPYVLKYKFRADADVVVKATGLEGKENMSLQAWDPTLGKLVDIGNCTARAGDGDKIKAGDVITVNYAYFSSGGRLVQPTLPRLRPGDKTPQECTLDQFRRAFGK